MKAIAYYRVSTAKQGYSGLGLEAQQASVSAFLQTNRYELIQSYTEVESGRKNNRPQLLAAIEQCKKDKALLIIAKLDRLSRNVAFIANLMESKVKFKAIDMPEADSFILHILAAVAQREREMISQRTKEALAAAKARGIKLGTTIQPLADHNRLLAKEEAVRLQPVIARLRDSGIVTVKALAEAMNKHPTQVQRILSRLK